MKKSIRLAFVALVIASVTLSYFYYKPEKSAADREASLYSKSFFLSINRRDSLRKEADSLLMSYVNKVTCGKENIDMFEKYGDLNSPYVGVVKLTDGKRYKFIIDQDESTNGAFLVEAFREISIASNERKSIYND